LSGDVASIQAARQLTPTQCHDQKCALKRDQAYYAAENILAWAYTRLDAKEHGV